MELSVSEYLAEIGAKGGRTTGPNKARDPEKMRVAALKSWEGKRKRKRKHQEPEESKSGDNDGFNEMLKEQGL